MRRMHYKRTIILNSFVWVWVSFLIFLINYILIATKHRQALNAHKHNFHIISLSIMSIINVITIIKRSIYRKQGQGQMPTWYKITKYLV